MAIKFIRGLDKVLNLIDRILMYFAGLLLLFLVFSISFSVIMRYFFNSPIAWTVEISEYIMMFITFLTIAWVLRIDGHVKIDVITNMLSLKVKRILNIIICIITASAFFILFYFSTISVIDLYSKNVMALQTLAVPKFIVILPISIGSLLFALRSFLKIFDKSILNNKEMGR